MAVYSGKDGSVALYYGDTEYPIAEMDEWTITVTTDSEPSESFGDEWHENAPTLRTWTGSFSGRLDLTDTTGQGYIQNIILGNVAAVTGRFHVNGTSYYSGDLYISTEALAAAVSGLVTGSFDFQGTGALTYNAA